jgi:hypothetical protein
MSSKPSLRDNAPFWYKPFWYLVLRLKGYRHEISLWAVQVEGGEND